MAVTIEGAKEDSRRRLYAVVEVGELFVDEERLYLKIEGGVLDVEHLMYRAEGFIPNTRYVDLAKPSVRVVIEGQAPEAPEAPALPQMSLGTEEGAVEYQGQKHEALSREEELERKRIKASYIEGQKRANEVAEKKVNRDIITDSRYDFTVKKGKTRKAARQIFSGGTGG
jgi:hypothetical protein